MRPEARTALCDIGFDPAFGARPLKRAITTHLMNPMAKAIVGGGFHPGDTIQVEYIDGAIRFNRVPGAGEASEAPRQIPVTGP